MSPITESLLTLALIIGLQLMVYMVFLRPKISTWGASGDEVNMPLFGDDLAPGIASTRAITIDAPVSEVWQWIIQLGADRGGFFSYAFIEKILGYEKRDADNVPEFQDMEIGRMVPGSLDESKSVIKYNFRVTAVEPGKSFVLEDWGAFVLNPIHPNQTRLIVRNHEQEQPNLLGKIGGVMMSPMHYIMERRMMMGFKAQAEAGAGVRLSSAPDNWWLLGVVLSGIGIISMVFMGRGVLSIVLSVVYSTLWLLTLLIFDPRPRFSLSLLLLIVATTVWLL